jgi:hypothetical protein
VRSVIGKYGAYPFDFVDKSFGTLDIEPMWRKISITKNRRNSDG